MFTLALGDDLDEHFLQKIIKLANRGEELMNKGQQNPIHYYQLVTNVGQLNRIFTDISLGISEQMEAVQSELRIKQTILENLENES